MTRYLFVFFGVILSLNAFAFNYQKCKYLSKRRHVLDFSTTSTFQFSSSTGECSALAKKVDMQKRFYIVNYDKVMNDFAKGNGEYANALFEFSSCNIESRNKMIKDIKEGFSRIHGLAGEDSFFLIQKTIQLSCQKV